MLIKRLVLAFFLFVVVNASYATIIYDSNNGFISEINNLNVKGVLYDVSFETYFDTDFNSQIALWSDVSLLEAAENALVAELNSASTYIVTAGNGINNNDFYLARYELSGEYYGDHLRAVSVGGYSLFGVNHPILDSHILASFEVVGEASGTVPEPNTIFLLTMGLLGVAGISRKHKNT